MTDSIDELRRKLQALQDLHDRGDLSAPALADARAPLERELVALVVSGPPSIATTTLPAAPVAANADTRPRPSRALSASVLGGIVLLAVIGYAWTGSPRLALNTPDAGVATADAAPPDANAAAPTEEQVREMVDRLAERLRQQPDDLVGQTMLARSYQVMGRGDEAIAAFRKALSLAGNDAALMVDLADALAANSNGDLTGEPTRLIQRALEIDPTNLKVLAMAGTAAFDRRDYATAVTRWEQVERALPRDSTFLPQVQSSVALARQLGAMSPADAAAAIATAKGPATAPGPASTPASSGPAQAAAADPAAQAISGTLTLAPALRSKVAADDTVFVVARAANGPRMPLAVLRRQVKDLPFSFSLDDSMAMSPSAKISDHAEVIVVARISKSGDAMPQPGDISGQSAPVKPGMNGVQVEFNQVLSATPSR